MARRVAPVDVKDTQSLLQVCKVASMRMTGSFRRALRVYVGPGVMQLTAGLFRLTLRDPHPPAAVLLAALAGGIGS